MKNTYHLIDSGNGRKLEQFGPYLLARPAAQAVWHPQLPEDVWHKANAAFTREGNNRWTQVNNPESSSTPQRPLPENWTIEVSGITFKLSTTDFGHLGIFPEQREFWIWIQDIIKKAISEGRKEVKVLNLFAYSGGSTLAAAKAGAHVCHLDASKGMVAWARENAALSHLDKAPIRWIVDDVKKFLARELKRESRYDAIILDPPTFGRGASGEIFKIEDDLQTILKNCRALLTPQPLFVLFSCHTPGFTPIVMEHLMTQMMGNYGGKLDVGEMVLKGDRGVFSLPSGSYARWSHE